MQTIISNLHIQISNIGIKSDKCGGKSEEDEKNSFEEIVDLTLDNSENMMAGTSYKYTFILFQPTPCLFSLFFLFINNIIIVVGSGIY